ncbi:MAG TPA: PadR family transcriptional regulator [Mycobacteriales bacterium]|nr:PadR family transcriptional regulator [Mycobacteriales bacterium]
MDAGGARQPLSQLRRGVLEYCVLSLLDDEPLYGFDLVRRLGDVDGMVTSEGTIYPLLSRLRREGRVTTTWVESEAGPPRRYYALTAEGRTALAGFAEEWRRFRDAVDSLLPAHLPVRTAPARPRKDRS